MVKNDSSFYLYYSKYLRPEAHDFTL